MRIRRVITRLGWVLGLVLGLGLVFFLPVLFVLTIVFFPVTILIGMWVEDAFAASIGTRRRD